MYFSYLLHKLMVSLFTEIQCSLGSFLNLVSILYYRQGENTFISALYSRIKNTLFHQRNPCKYIYSIMENSTESIVLYISLARRSSKCIRIRDLYQNLLCQFIQHNNVLSTVISQFMFIKSSWILKFQRFPLHTIYIKNNTSLVVSTVVHLKWDASHWPLLLTQ